MDKKVNKKGQGTVGDVRDVGGRKTSILTKGAPDRLPSGSIQHGLFTGDADLELYRFYLDPVELRHKREGAEDGWKYYRQTKDIFQELPT